MNHQQQTPNPSTGMSEDHSFISVRGNFPELCERGVSRRLSQASTSVRSLLQPVVEYITGFKQFNVNS